MALTHVSKGEQIYRGPLEVCQYHHIQLAEKNLQARSDSKDAEIDSKSKSKM